MRVESAIDRLPSGLVPFSLVGDARLARLAARGDEAAFAAIFRRYHQPLYRYCRALTGNREDASDALQNTMVKAMRSLPGERRAVQLKPWLFRVAHNESISLLRARRSDSALDEGHGGAVDGPEVGESFREELRELMSDLRELPDRQRATVILRELNGLTYTEIADVLGTSTPAAKQAAYDGRVALQDYAGGRAMECDAVLRAISDREGESIRGRKLRGHLRSCDECASFKRALDRRSGQLAAIAPALPATAAAALMQKLFGGGGSAGGGSVGLSAAGAKLAASAGALKATGAMVAAITVAAGGAVGGQRLARDDGPTSPASDSAAAAATGDPDASDRAAGRGSRRSGSPGDGPRQQGEGRAGRATAPDGPPAARSADPHLAPGGVPTRGLGEADRRREAANAPSPYLGRPAPRPERQSTPPAEAFSAPEPPPMFEVPAPQAPASEILPEAPFAPSTPDIAPSTGR